MALHLPPSPSVSPVPASGDSPQQILLAPVPHHVPHHALPPSASSIELSGSDLTLHTPLPSAPTIAVIAPPTADPEPVPLVPSPRELDVFAQMDSDRYVRSLSAEQLASAVAQLRGMVDVFEADFGRSHAGRAPQPDETPADVALARARYQRITGMIAEESAAGSATDASPAPPEPLASRPAEAAAAAAAAAETPVSSGSPSADAPLPLPAGGDKIVAEACATILFAQADGSAAHAKALTGVYQRCKRLYAEWQRLFRTVRGRDPVRTDLRPVRELVAVLKDLKPLVVGATAAADAEAD
jgi:hypothetical protein